MGSLPARSTLEAVPPDAVRGLRSLPVEPLFVGETSHVGIGRAAWLREIASDLFRANTAAFHSRGVVSFP